MQEGGAISVATTEYARASCFLVSLWFLASNLTRICTGAKRPAPAISWAVTLLPFLGTHGGWPPCRAQATACRGRERPGGWKGPGRDEKVRVGGRNLSDPRRGLQKHHGALLGRCMALCICQRHQSGPCLHETPPARLEIPLVAASTSQLWTYHPARRPEDHWMPVTLAESGSGTSAHCKQR